MKKRKGKAFLLNYAGHDTSGIKRYTKEIVLLSEGNVNIFDLDRLKFNFKEQLTNNNFDIKEDFIVLSGNLILGFILGEVLGQYYDDEVKLLLWDAKQCNYKLREFNIKGGNLKQKGV